MPYTKQFAIIQPFVQYCTKIQPDIKKSTAGFEIRLLSYTFLRCSRARAQKSESYSLRQSYVLT